MDSTISTRSAADKIHRIWGDPRTVDGAFDLYFRIGLPNEGNKDIQKIKIEHVTVDSNNTISSVVATRIFSYTN